MANNQLLTGLSQSFLGKESIAIRLIVYLIVGLNLIMMQEASASNTWYSQPIQTDMNKFKAISHDIRAQITPFLIEYYKKIPQVSCQVRSTCIDGLLNLLKGGIQDVFPESRTDLSSARQTLISLYNAIDSDREKDVYPTPTLIMKHMPQDVLNAWRNGRRVQNPSYQMSFGDTLIYLMGQMVYQVESCQNRSNCYARNIQTMQQVQQNASTQDIANRIQQIINDFTNNYAAEHPLYAIALTKDLMTQQGRNQVDSGNYTPITPIIKPIPTPVVNPFKPLKPSPWQPIKPIDKHHKDHSKNFISILEQAFQGKEQGIANSLANAADKGINTLLGSALNALTGSTSSSTTNSLFSKDTSGSSYNSSQNVYRGSRFSGSKSSGGFTSPFS